MQRPRGVLGIFVESREACVAGVARVRGSGVDGARELARGTRQSFGCAKDFGFAPE